MKATNHRLLVVEDNAAVRKVMVTLLRDLVGSVDQASDGEEGLTRFQTLPYDLVLTDWDMPRVDGLAMLRSIRAGEHRATTPVLMLSGQVTRSRIVEAITAGANAFFPKPFESTALRNKVLSMLPGGAV